MSDLYKILFENLKDDTERDIETEIETIEEAEKLVESIMEENKVIMLDRSVEAVKNRNYPFVGGCLTIFEYKESQCPYCQKESNEWIFHHRHEIIKSGSRCDLQMIKSDDKNEYVFNVNWEQGMYQRKINFCPICGRKLG